MESKLTNYRSNIKANAGVFYTKFSAAPLALKALAIFAVIVTVLHVTIVLLVRGELFTAYKEEFGVMTGSDYGFTLFWVFALIFAGKGSRPQVLRLMIVAPLVIVLVVNYLILSTIINGGAMFKDAGMLGLIWTLILPAIWVIVLFSPAVSRYCSRINSKK